MLKTINRVRRVLPKNISRLRAMFAKGAQEYRLPHAERYKRTQRRLLRHGVKSMVETKGVEDTQTLRRVRDFIDKSPLVRDKKAEFTSVATSRYFTPQNRRVRVVKDIREVRAKSGSKKARNMLKRAGEIYFRKNNPWYKRP